MAPCSDGRAVARALLGELQAREDSDESRGLVSEMAPDSAETRQPPRRPSPRVPAWTPCSKKLTKDARGRRGGEGREESGEGGFGAARRPRWDAE